MYPSLGIRRRALYDALRAADVSQVTLPCRRAAAVCASPSGAAAGAEQHRQRHPALAVVDQSHVVADACELALLGAHDALRGDRQVARRRCRCAASGRGPRAPAGTRGRARTWARASAARSATMSAAQVVFSSPRAAAAASIIRRRRRVWARPSAAAKRVHRRHADGGDDHVRGGVVGDREHQQVEVGQAEGRSPGACSRAGRRRRARACRPRGRAWPGRRSPRSAALQSAAEISTLIVLAAGTTAWALRSNRRPLRRSTAATETTSAAQSSASYSRRTVRTRAFRSAGCASSTTLPCSDEACTIRPSPAQMAMWSP